MLFNNDISINLPYEPREFQKVGFDKIINSPFNKILAIAPCGAGKSYLIMMLAKYYIEQGKRVLFMVHRLTILDQIIEEARQYGFNVGVIQANHELTNEFATFQIASEATIIRRDIKEYDVLIKDEAHYMTDKISKLLKSTDKKVIGLTATPFKEGMADIYEEMFNIVTAQELTKLGILSPLKIISGRKIQISKLSKDFSGEWSADSVERASDEILGDMVDLWKKYADNQSTIVFGSRISHAQKISDEFNANGIMSAVFCADTTKSDREKYLNWFKSGKIKVLCSVEALSVGFNVPTASVCISARPLRKSFSTIVQSYGRILRSAPGKEQAVLIDCDGNIKRFADDWCELFLEGVTELKSAQKTDKKVKDKEEKPEVTRPSSNCPVCESSLWLNNTCLACGHVIPPKSCDIQHVIENVEFEEIDLFKGKKNQTNNRLWMEICKYVYSKTTHNYRNVPTMTKRALALYKNISGEFPKYGEQFHPASNVSDAVMLKIHAANEEYRLKQQVKIHPLFSKALGL